jgi:hypothetical protein
MDQLGDIGTDCSQVVLALDDDGDAGKAGCTCDLCDVLGC